MFLSIDVYIGKYTNEIHDLRGRVARCWIIISSIIIIIIIIINIIIILRLGKHIRISIVFNCEKFWKLSSRYLADNAPVKLW